MYSSRRKSKRSYRKRVASRKNKTRSKRKNLKFRKMRGGGGTSYYTFIEEYERAKKYIDDKIAVPFNTHLINELKMEYPYFLETYNNDKANNTKSPDRLTPEEEARIAKEEARIAEEKAKAADAAKRLKEERKKNPFAGVASGVYIL